jgi:hypothetical protein
VTVASPTSAAGALTTYKVGFKTSASGSLTSSSTITITLPAGTSLANLVGSPVNLGTTQVGFCTHPSNTVATCQLYSGQTIAASKAVVILLNGVINPKTTSTTDTLTFKTSSDLTTVTSPTYAITAAHSLGTVPVSLSSSLPGATGVTYALSVKTSASGGLAGDTGSSINIVLPSGTDLTNFGTNSVMVGTTQVGFCSHPSGTTVICQLYTGVTVAANTTAAISFAGVKNPSTAATYNASVSTTSDPAVKKSAGYCVVAAGVPCIATVAPTSGGVGAAVTITGLNLAGATALKFHGTTAAILTNTATKITTKVPAGATTGTLTVTTGGGTATSPAAFTVVPAPAITSFSPASGPVGTTVTITGTSLTGATALTFHGTAATILTDTATQITAKVPTGATTGTIAVTTAGGTGTSATSFTVT